MESDKQPAKKKPQQPRVKWGKFYFDDEMAKQAARTAKWDGSPDLEALKSWVVKKAEEKGFAPDSVFPPGGLTTSHVAGRLKTLQRKDARIRKQAAEAVEKMFAPPPASAAAGSPKGVVLRMDSDTDVDEDFPLDLPVPERAPQLEAQQEKPKVTPPSLPPITDSMRDFWVASASDLPSLPSLPPHVASAAAAAVAAAAPKGIQRKQTRRVRKGPTEHDDEDGEETEDEMPPLERPGPILQYIQKLHAIQHPSAKRQRVDVSPAVAEALFGRFEGNMPPEEAIRRAYKQMGWKIPPGGVQAGPGGLADLLKED
jgi:predicted component of type VI protein secretion system